MSSAKGVSIKDITKVFISHNKDGEFRAVNHVSVDIRPGEFVTLLGPSGCGKTTILRMVAGFEIPTSGDICLDGKRINDLTPDKRDTAMVFQSYALFPHLNIYDNIIYGLSLKKLSKAEIKRKAEEIIELVGLKGMENRSPNQISGGQQQRVALARALVMEPGVLLFDEPLSNLDAKLRVYMRTEIKKLQRKAGITALYVTHDQAEAMSLSDRIIIMNKGVIEQVGSPEEIYYQPVNEFVARFIGEANFFDAVIREIRDDRAIVDFAGELLTVEYKGNKKAGESCRMVVRPEAFILGENGKVPGIVKRSSFMGAQQEYTVEVDGNDVELIDSNPKGKRKYREGEQVMLDFKEENIHII